MEHVFTDNGINDVDLGATLYHALQVGQEELSDPANSQKLQDIATFLNEEPDPYFTISSVTRSKTNPDISNINHLWSYVQLKTQRTGLQTKLENLDKELKLYG